MLPADIRIISKNLCMVSRVDNNIIIMLDERREKATTSYQRIDSHCLVLGISPDELSLNLKMEDNRW